jgi:hypothetical protein
MGPFVSIQVCSLSAVPEMDERQVTPTFALSALGPEYLPCCVHVVAVVLHFSGLLEDAFKVG